MIEFNRKMYILSNFIFLIVVKTTIMIDDDLYKRLVNESIEKYGSTRKLSLLINRRLRESERKEARRELDIKPIKLGRKISEMEIERAIEEGWSEAVRWKA